MQHTVVTDPRDLHRIVDLIHDCWFDKDEVEFHQKTRVLSIKFRRRRTNKARVVWAFGPLRRLEVPLVDCFLYVHHVSHHSIVDREGVRIYDFNRIKYDETTRSLWVETGIPIDIKVTVDDFKVVVEETDNVGELTRSFSLF